MRAAVIAAGCIDVESGTAIAAISSEEPYLRPKDPDYGTHNEILSHRAGDLNNAIAEKGAPVLLNHDPSKVVGETIPGTLRIGRDRKARLQLRVYPEHRDILRKIQTGEGQNAVSVGYHRLGVVSRDDSSSVIPTIRFSWLLEEVSILTEGNQPADPTVGFGRSLSFPSIMKRNTFDDILELARTRGEDDLLTRARDEASIADLIFRRAKGFTREVAESCDFIAGEPVSGGFWPWGGLVPRKTRDMTAYGGIATGGAFIQTDLHPSIPVLYNHTAAIRLGCRVRSGLKGNAAFPRISTGTLPSWLGETDAANLQDLFLDQPAALPKRLTVQRRYSMQLAENSGEALEDLFRADISEGVGVTLDKAILFGAGGLEPLGIMNTPGVAAHHFGGAAQWADVLALSKALDDANAGLDSRGLACSPATITKWKSILRTGNSTRYLMDDDGAVNGMPSAGTNNLAGVDRILFCNWSDVVLLLWGDGLHFLFDYVTRAGQGEVVVTACVWASVLLRHPQSCLVSSDSAAQ